MNKKLAELKVNKLADYQDKIIKVLEEGMTNGEVLQSLFPDIESRLDERTGIILVKWADGTCKTFKASWWNAPYQKGGE